MKKYIIPFALFIGALFASEPETAKISLATARAAAEIATEKATAAAKEQSQGSIAALNKEIDQLKASLGDAKSAYLGLQEIMVDEKLRREGVLFQREDLSKQLLDCQVNLAVMRKKATDLAARVKELETSLALANQEIATAQKEKKP